MEWNEKRQPDDNVESMLWVVSWIIAALLLRYPRRRNQTQTIHHTGEEAQPNNVEKVLPIKVCGFAV